MIADTTFCLDLLRERRAGRRGPAGAFLARHRARTFRLTIITAGELAAGFPDNAAAWAWLSAWTIYRLHPGIVDAAAEIDRQLMAEGSRLGENDNWIAGFARYYREPLVSRDAAFDHAPLVRRLNY